MLRGYGRGQQIYLVKYLAIRMMSKYCNNTSVLSVMIRSLELSK